MPPALILSTPTGRAAGTLRVEVHVASFDASHIAKRNVRFPMGQRSIVEFFATRNGPTTTTGQDGRTHTACDTDSDDEDRGKFVDLFAGIGGASTGATNAGYNVVLAVDNWELAMETHAINHPRTHHLCMQLPPAAGEELPLPAAGEKWHLHGSPPCTLLSEANHRTRTAEEFAEGLAMVRWYIDYALASSATTGAWSR